jgi:hypothetical protein
MSAYGETARLQDEVHRLEDRIRRIEDSQFFWRCIALSAFLVGMLGLWR